MRNSVSLILLAAVTAHSCSAQEATKASPVVVSEVEQRELAAGQVLIGSVLPVRRSMVGSAIDGRIESYHVERGQAIEEGKPLAKLRTKQLEISRRAAVAELASRNAMLTELKNGARPEEIAQAAGELAAAKAMLTSAKSRYSRAKKLYSQGAMNDEQLQDALAASERAVATYAAADAKHRLLKKGTRPEKILAAQANLDFQSEQVKLIEEQIARHTVVAPFDGYISSEFSEVGQWVGRGDAIAEVIDLSEVEVEVFVLERYLANLKVGETVQVSVPAVPSEFFSGRIHSIVPQADVRSRSFPVRIRIKNTIETNGPALKSGMLARANMPLGRSGETTLVDKDAIVFGGEKPMIYTLERNVPVNGESKVRGIPVKLGVMDGSLIQITGAIKVGSQVVIRGNERLANGETVKVQEIRTPVKYSSDKKMPNAAKSAKKPSKPRNGIGS